LPPPNIDTVRKHHIQIHMDCVQFFVFSYEIVHACMLEVAGRVRVHVSDTLFVCVGLCMHVGFHGVLDDWPKCM